MKINRSISYQRRHSEYGQRVNEPQAGNAHAQKQNPEHSPIAPSALPELTKEVEAYISEHLRSASIVSSNFFKHRNLYVTKNTKEVLIGRLGHLLQSLKRFSPLSNRPMRIFACLTVSLVLLVPVIQSTFANSLTIEYVTQNAASNSGASSLDIPVPAGIASGDTVIVSVITQGGSTISINSVTGNGLSFIRSEADATIRQSTFYKVSNGTEPANYTFNFTECSGNPCSDGPSSQKASGGIIAFRNVNTSNPINTHGGQANAASTTVTAPSVTTTAENTMLVGIFGQADSGTITSDSMADRYYSSSSGGKSTTLTAIRGSNQTQAATGATGTRTATGSNVTNIGHLIALEPQPVSVLNQSAYRWFDNDDTIGGEKSFAKAWGGTNDDSSNDVLQTSDGGYVVIGYTQSYGAGGYDQTLVKYDSNGIEQWSKTWGGAGSDLAYGVIQTSDGGYAVAGYTNSYGAGGLDQTLVKYDSNGIEQWSKTWGAAGSDYALELVETSDGGYAVAGYTNSYGAGDYDQTLVKYDSNGIEQWSKTWGGTGIDRAYSVIQSGDGGLVVVGVTNSYGAGDYDQTLVKYDSNGIEQWSKAWGGTGADHAFALVQTSDGGYVVGGYTFSYGAGSNDQTLVKYDSNGIEQWSKTWGGTWDDTSRGLAYTADGGFVTVGFTLSFGDSGNYNQTLVKYDSNGIEQWSKAWGLTGNDYARAIIQATDGGYAVVGETASYGAGGIDQSFIKYDSTGQITNCSSCNDVAVPETDHAITEGSVTITEVDHAITEGSVTITEVDQTANTTVTDIEDGSLGEVNIGVSLAAQDTVATAPAEGIPFRLRTNMHVDNLDLSAGKYNFKLQYAQRSSDDVCDTSFTGESYADVSSPNGYISNQWTEENAGASWVQRNGHEVVELNGVLYLFGGYTGSSTYLNDVWSSSDGIIWTQETANAPWPARMDHSAVVYNNKIWMFGGYNGTSYNDVWSSTDGANWSQETSSAPWSARSMHTSEVFDGKMWILAGFNGSADLRDVWSSTDGVNWTQETASAAWPVRSEHASFVMNNKMYIAGGYGLLNDVWSTVDGVSWVEETASAAWSGRYEHAITVVNGTAWLVGGYAGNTEGFKNDVWTTTDGASWTQKTDAPWEPRGYYESLFFDNKLWIFGGYDNPNRYNDVWATPIEYGDIAFYNNTNASDGMAFAESVDDPVHGSPAHTTVYQTYEEINNFTNSTTIPNGQDGMWDFALVDKGAPGDTHYCFRIVKADDSLLDSYTVIPEIKTGPATYEQSSYRWFDNKDAWLEFGAGGVAQRNPTTGTDAAYAVAKDDEYMYVTGYDSLNGNQWRVEKRKLSDGAVCTAAACGTQFGSSGVVQHNPSSRDDRPHSVAVDDTHIYIVGYDAVNSGVTSNTQWRILKLDKTTGGADSSFGSSGVVTYNFGSLDDKAHGITVYGDYIYVTGYEGVASGDTQGRIEKRNKITGALCDGAVNCDDGQFATGGYYRYDAGTGNETPYSIAVDEGNIYFAASHQSSQMLVRSLNRLDGSVIASSQFDAVTGGGGAPFWNNIFIDDNYVYTAGQGGDTGSDAKWWVSKHNKTTLNPCLDSLNCTSGAFDGDGILVVDPSTADDALSTISIDTNNIYLAGTDRSVDGGYSRYLIQKRDIATGALVTSFGTSGAVTYNPSTNHDEPRGMVVDEDHMYVVGYDVAPGNYQWNMQKRKLSTGALQNTYEHHVGAAKAAQDTAFSTSGLSDVFRLRSLVKVTDKSAANSQFKLQYAAKVGSCDTAFVGESYRDVISLGGDARSPSSYSPGNIGLSNPSNMYDSDNQYASAGFSDPAGTSDNQLTGYGFSIPTDAVIEGIEVKVERRAMGTIYDNEMVLLKNGVPTGLDKKKSGTWSTSEEIVTYGSPTDLWGSTWAPSDINSVNFGVEFGFFTDNSGDGFIDHIEVIVHVESSQFDGGIYFYDNTVADDGRVFSANVNDPTNATTVSRQAYVESNSFLLNSVAKDNSGLFDFGLFDNSARGGSYCFRIVKADGSLLDVYSFIPEITLPAKSKQLMRNGKYFDAAGVIRPSYW